MVHRLVIARNGCTALRCCATVRGNLPITACYCEHVTPMRLELFARRSARELRGILPDLWLMRSQRLENTSMKIVTMKR